MVITVSRSAQFSMVNIAVTIFVSEAGAAFLSAFLSNITVPSSRLTRNAISALVSSEELYDALDGKTSEQISITAVSIIDATRFNYKIPLEKN